MMATSKRPREARPAREIDAIYKRRTIRDYKPQKIEAPMINALLNAAVQAPTALREEPWAFAIIQDKETLKKLNETIQGLIYNEARNYPKLMNRVKELTEKPDFNAFYNAGTLIVIYSRFQRPFVVADCWLAAQNLMLTACVNGLGTCVVALAVPALNTPEWKSKLHIGSEMIAIAPIIVGVPARSVEPVPRFEPDILSWI
ncbi:nitroreductase family protein [Legionella lytica]|nr:nitroreductase family protein [Legionella lytica]